MCVIKLIHYCAKVLKKPVISGQCWQVPLLHSGGAKHHIHSFFVRVFKLELKEIWAAKRWLQKKKEKKSDSPAGEGADILCFVRPLRMRWRRRFSRCSSWWSKRGGAAEWRLLDLKPLHSKFGLHVWADFNPGAWKPSRQVTRLAGIKEIFPWMNILWWRCNRSRSSAQRPGRFVFPFLKNVSQWDNRLLGWATHLETYLPKWSQGRLSLSASSFLSKRLLFSVFGVRESQMRGKFELPS